MIRIGDILEGTLSMNASGSAYLTSENLPKDIYIHKTNTNKALHLDTVKVKVVEGKGRPLEGKIIDVVERFKDEFVGVLQVSDRYAFLIPDSNKMPVDIFIPLSKLNGGMDGQKAIGKLTNWKDDARSPNGEILEVLGEAGENNAEIHAILHEYGLPYNFDEDVLAEANAIPLEISEEEIAKRKDMRDVLTFTIDPDTAKDFDDALSLEWVDGKMRVGIHIADVSHYVRPETDLDKEAYMRGTSVYLVDRCVSMLPEHLSNGVCSLRPNEDKLAFSAIFTLDQNGHVEEEWFGRTVIHSDARFTYEQAQFVIENGVVDLQMQIQTIGETSEPLASNLRDVIVDLDRMAKKMRAQRFTRGSISFDKHEVKFKLDENDKPIEVMFRTSKDAHKLIEEYMLLANRKVAQYCNTKALLMVQRAHDRPDEEKLEHLKEFIKQFGYTINTNTPKEITSTLNKLLSDVQGKPEQNMIENLVLRSMQKAIYTTELIGHYGLGFTHYTHFTSPIRRYPDIMVHRLMSRYLDGKNVQNANKYGGRCKHLSDRERKAQKAQRESIKYKQCEFMADRIGKVYEGIVTSIMDYGIFVEITENKCEGLVRMSEIGGDVFTADQDNHCIKGFNTGEKIKLGDEVHIVVKSVDIERKNIDFTLIRL